MFFLVTIMPIDIKTFNSLRDFYFCPSLNRKIDPFFLFNEV